eukprot:3578706-Alexandrium_andersonii.AAC.1
MAALSDAKPSSTCRAGCDSTQLGLPSEGAACTPPSEPKARNCPCRAFNVQWAHAQDSVVRGASGSEL